MRSGGAVAAIDCGTNSTRLLVADPTGAPLERQMRITRLGEGVDETGVLAQDAIERCLCGAQGLPDDDGPLQRAARTSCRHLGARGMRRTVTTSSARRPRWPAFPSRS